MSVNIRGMRGKPFCVTAFALNGTGGIPLGGVLKGDIVENVRNITTGASRLWQLRDHHHGVGRDSAEFGLEPLGQRI